MRGLELSEKYWNNVGKPAVTRKLPGLLDHAAFGMGGEGSENFGFDD